MTSSCCCRDWETSDKSMQYLEQRIRQFMSRTGDQQQSHYAPKLSRFENKVSVTFAPKLSRFENKVSDTLGVAVNTTSFIYAVRAYLQVA